MRLADAIMPDRVGKAEDAVDRKKKERVGLRRDAKVRGREMQLCPTVGKEKEEMCLLPVRVFILGRRMRSADEKGRDLTAWV